MTTKDESPIETPTEPPTPPTPPTPPEPPTPPTPDEPPTPPHPPTHKDGDKVPEWGQDLSAKVDGLSESLAKLLPADPPEPKDGESVLDDATPVKPPFHKRSLGSFFGFDT